jgi:thiamine monophosphate synthase
MDSEAAESPLHAAANGAFLLPRTRGRPGGGAPAASIAQPRSLLIGRSTHSVDEVLAARDEGVDYVTFGPIWATPGKGAPLGTAALARAAAAGVPVYALGGVTLERLGELAAAGAAGAAAIRMFQRPAELAGLARTAARAFARSV